MRRASGASSQGITRTQQAATQPQVGPDSSAWWESRLLPYCQAVLFIWSALTFSPSFLPGVAIWGLLNILVMSVFQFSGSMLEVLGNFLVITAILYALLHVGLRYGNLTLFPVWNRDNDAKFHEICTLLSKLTCVLSTGLQETVNSRHSNPKMFYGSGFVASFLLYHLGCWVSSVYCVHMLVCALLLVPLVMERYKPQPEQLEVKVHRVWAELTHLLRTLAVQLQQRLNRVRRSVSR